MRKRNRGEDKTAALSTMRYVLHALSRVMAPSMPFFAEYLFQEIREGEDEESVHLAMWPEPHATANFFARLLGMGGTNDDLLKAMTVARTVVSAALEAREKAGIKIRQPLAMLMVPTSMQLEQEFVAIIAAEVNVKEISFTEEGGVTLNTEITQSLKEEGIVRDAKRLIQDQRKTSGKLPSDVIVRATLFVPLHDAEILARHTEELQSGSNISHVDVVSQEGPPAVTFAE